MKLVTDFLQQPRYFTEWNKHPPFEPMCPPSNLSFVSETDLKEQRILNTNEGKNSLKLPQMSNQHWRRKNEQHLNMD